MMSDPPNHTTTADGADRLELSEAEEWIRQQVTPARPITLAHRRPWATVLRVPLTDGVAWFKACGPVQAFEPRLTAELFSRWPDLLAEVLAYDEGRAWLLSVDSGTQISELGNPPELWEEVLPLYSELQRNETAHRDRFLADGVPDLGMASLTNRYQQLLDTPLPLHRDEIDQLCRFQDRVAQLCEELQAHGVADSVQHDDLHMNNLYLQDGRLRVLDWGDSSISHPFASLVVTFRFLEQVNRLPPTDPWFERLRDAYLEPWGPDLKDTLDLAMRVGAFAHAIACARQREFLSEQDRSEFDQDYGVVLRRALTLINL